MLEINIRSTISSYGRRKWQPTPVFLPRVSRGQRSLVGCCPWGRTEADMTEGLCVHACIGEGNGDPLQCSCLESPMHRGAWWAAVHGVAPSQRQLKRLSMHACTGEGNGNPLQYSCLENPRDRRAWWAAVYGVAQSRARLKWLCSSSRSISMQALLSLILEDGPL